MAGTTSTHKIPYPTSTDPIANYPTTGRSLADTIDTKLTSINATIANVSDAVAARNLANSMIIGGKTYDASKPVTVTGIGFTQLGPAANGLWYGNKAIARPGTAPSGYGWAYVVRSANHNLAQVSVVGDEVSMWVFSWAKPAAGSVWLEALLVKI